MIKILKANDKEELSIIGAKKIEDSINRILIEKGLCVFAIPGGRSVSGVFKNLLNAKIDWTKVHIFMVDERLVSIDDFESNYKQAFDIFLSEMLKLNKIPAKNIHPFIYKEEKETLGLLRYEKELKSIGDRLDVVLLSSGEDCHVAGLYPNHHSIRSDAEFFISMQDSPKPPIARMSCTKKFLKNADTIILLFSGEGKRDAWKKFCNEKYSVIDCPAKIIHMVKNAYVITDNKISELSVYKLGKSADSD